MKYVCGMVLLLVPVLSFLSCVRASSSGNSGVDQSEFEIKTADQPGPTTGSYIVTFDNVRARCGFEDREDYYRVTCYAVTQSDWLDEVQSLSTEPGLNLTWLDPERISGGGFSFQSCTQSANGIRYQCDVYLTDSKPTEIRFRLKVESQNRTREESDKVLLPLRVETFGVVKTNPMVFEPGSPDFYTKEQFKGLGYQRHLMDAKDFAWEGVESICTMGKVSYFSSGKFVYALEDDRVWLFAGSNQEKLPLELPSHRLDLALNEPILTCGDQSLYIADYFEDGFEINDGKSSSYLWEVFNKGQVRKIAGGVPARSTGDGGPASQARFSRALSIALDKDGSIYLGFKHPHRIRKIFPDGHIDSVIGTGTPGNSGDGGPAIAAGIDEIHGMAFADDGSFYFSSGTQIRHVDVKGKISSIETDIRLGALAISRKGELFMIEQGHHRIHKLVGKKIQRIAGSIAGLSGDGGPATNAQFRLRFRSSLSFTPDGSLLIADSENNRIRSISPNGTIHTLAGRTATQEFSQNNQNAKQSQFLATIIAMKSDGTLYAYFRRRNQIQKISPKGELSLVAGNGEQGIAKDGEKATEAELEMITHMAFGVDGLLYFSEIAHNYNRIRRINREGQLETVVGRSLKSRAWSAIGDGHDARLAILSRPESFTFAPDGTLFISDSAHRRVRRVDLDGKISTVAGGGQIGQETNGMAIKTRIANPTAIAYLDGAIYFVESLTQMRVVTSDGKISTIQRFAPQSLTFVGNKLYFADNGTLGVLDPPYTGKPRFLIKDKKASMCGAGVLEKNVEFTASDEVLKASLSKMCIGRITSVSGLNRCAYSEKSHYLVFAQRLGFDSNIIKVTMPCLQSIPSQD